MYSLNSNFNEEEKKILNEYAGNNYYLLSSIDEECYILSEDGEYYYNDCFNNSDNKFLKNQKYEKAIPNRIIKFYEYYIMEAYGEPNIWYRGRRNGNKNYEFDCFCNNLQEVFDSI